MNIRERNDSDGWTFPRQHNLYQDVAGNDDWILYAACWCKDFPRIQNAVAAGGRVLHAHLRPGAGPLEGTVHTPLGVAFAYCDEEIVRFLLDQLTYDDFAGFDDRRESLLCCAIINIMPNIAVHLITTGRVDVGIRDNHGLTPLILAVGIGQPGVDIIPHILLRDPLQRFVRTPPRTCDHLTASPLHVAVQHGFLNSVKALLQLNDHAQHEFLHLQNEDGHTALHTAALFLVSTMGEMMCLLLDCSDTLAGVRDKTGRTALDLMYNY